MLVRMDVPLAVGNLGQWFWCSDILTGNQAETYEQDVPSAPRCWRRKQGSRSMDEVLFFTREATSANRPVAIEIVPGRLRVSRLGWPGRVKSYCETFLDTYIGIERRNAKVVWLRGPNFLLPSIEFKRAEDADQFCAAFCALRQKLFGSVKQPLALYNKAKGLLAD